MNRQQFAQHLMAHGEAVAAVLAKYPPSVGAFMRAQFNLSVYPLAWIEQFAAALDQFRVAEARVAGTGERASEHIGKAFLEAWDESLAKRQAEAVPVAPPAPEATEPECGYSKDGQHCSCLACCYCGHELPVEAPRP